MRLLVTCLAFGLLSIPASALQTFLGPSPYLQCSDSPLDMNGSFFLENFEDGLLNVPGVTSSTGSATTAGSSLTDSVDGDDGFVDGLGRDGRSWFMVPGSTGLTFTFDDTVLGGFPTEAGIVWTDGATINEVIFEAFDASGTSLGTIVASSVGDGNFNSGTAEDRFFGVQHAAGVQSIHILSNPAPGAGGSGIEVDHLQFGFQGAGNTAWTDVGFGLSGAQGVPSLSGSGIPSASCPVTMQLNSARPVTPAFLVVGLSGLFAPFAGGTLVPSPDVVISGFATNGAGDLLLAGAWPQNVPTGTDVFLQFWIPDANGPLGLAASNGLKVVAQ